jgi:hypothetical protein
MRHRRGTIELLLPQLMNQTAEPRGVISQMSQRNTIAGQHVSEAVEEDILVVLKRIANALEYIAHADDDPDGYEPEPPLDDDFAR